MQQLDDGALLQGLYQGIQGLHQGLYQGKKIRGEILGACEGPAMGLYYRGCTW